MSGFLQVMILPNTFKRNPTTKPNFLLFESIFDFFVTFNLYFTFKNFLMFFYRLLLWSGTIKALILSNSSTVFGKQLLIYSYKGVYLNYSSLIGIFIV